MLAFAVTVDALVNSADETTLTELQTSERFDQKALQTVRFDVSLAWLTYSHTYAEDEQETTTQVEAIQPLN